jgi:hypothetical protein
MSKILIVCPTISGREADLDRCVKSYNKTLQDHEVRMIAPRDIPSWGKGVNAGIEEAGDVSEYDYIHLTADGSTLQRRRCLAACTQPPSS